MPASSRISGSALLAVIGVGLIGATIIVFLRSNGSSLVAGPRSNRAVEGGPKAVVDHLSWDLGVIESGEKLGHTFIVRNAGQAPLKLARGPKLCACTVTDLPDEPIAPGGQAKITMGFTTQAKRDELKPGHFSKAIHVLTNDPRHPDILLELTATVNRRLSVAPSPLMLAIDSSKRSSLSQRSGESLVYSERWDKFGLSVVKASRNDIQWRIEPATREELKDTRALSGYHVFVTMPPEMPEGRFADWIEFAAKPATGEDQAATCQLDIHCRVNGRLAFFGPKVMGGHVLQLGALQQGERVRETVLMKVNDPRRQLAVERIEVKPAFLQARIVPYAKGLEEIGLYRIEVEIPADAPCGAHLGTHCGVIRLKTDHPRLSTIEFQVDFALAGILRAP